jgi:2-polyprenyl-6-hydroxyphenyl methylase/3-demethylubiquinone-9 3-methyltransferase
MSGTLRHFEDAAGEYAMLSESRPEFDERFRLWRAAIDHVAPAGGVGLTAVDLGCGPGQLTEHLALRGFHTIAIDGSDKMLDHTRRRLEEHGVDSVELRRHGLPLPTDLIDELAGQVDVILMSSVIEYVDQDAEVLRQCARLLRSGGHLLISFPNRRSLYWRVQRRIGRTALFARSDSRYQRHQYDPVRVGELAQAAGLHSREITYFALPLQRFSERILRGRRPRLATLFLADLQRPLT